MKMDSAECRKVVAANQSAESRCNEQDAIQVPMVRTVRPYLSPAVLPASCCRAGFQGNSWRFSQIKTNPFCILFPTWSLDSFTVSSCSIVWIESVIYHSCPLSHSNGSANYFVDWSPECCLSFQLWLQQSGQFPARYTPHGHGATQP